MITKQIAGILYSYGYNLVREGTEQILSIKGVYEVGDTLKMDLHYNGKHWASEPMSKIGKEFFILAREMDLPSEASGVEYFVIDADGKMYTGVTYCNDNIWLKGERFYSPTHYQPIVKPKPPIY